MGSGAGPEPKPSSRRRPPEILTPGECHALLRACGRGPAGLRNRALIILLWRAGLRVGEALELRACDVWPDRGELAVLHGKGDRARMVGFDPMAAAALADWLRARARYPRPQAGPLFCTITRGHVGEPVSSSYVRAAIARAARRAGIGKAVRPHGLRHTHAAELAREGVPVHLIRRQLGHASLSTTARYVEHLAPGEVVAAMQQRPWPEAAPPPIS